MTEDQTNWLRANRKYQPIGRGLQYSATGMLHADGTFEPRQRGARPNDKQGSFEVGIRKDPSPDQRMG